MATRTGQARVAIAALLQVALAACSQTAPTPTPTASSDPVVIAAGDIACAPTDPSFNAGAGVGARCRQAATASVAAAQGATAVLVLGDQQYEHATLAEYEASYALSWGALKATTHPVAGNHEYFTRGAQGYFDYFGAAAGERFDGWYSYDVGTWHIVALNSNCAAAGGCGAGSRQEKWLRADLAGHPAACTLSYWHHPRFATSADTVEMDALWRALVTAGADVVLAGHQHRYERLAPLDATGAVDPARGMRSFVVGTGGKDLKALAIPRRVGSEVLNNSTSGVLRLRLRARTYDWAFVPIAGGTFTDAGSGTCH